MFWQSFSFILLKLEPYKVGIGDIERLLSRTNIRIITIIADSTAVMKNTKHVIDQ